MGGADPNRDATDDACRRRIALAIAELAHEDGLRQATIAEICLKAGVPRADFGRLYPSREEALRLAYATAFNDLFDPVREAATTAPSWLEGLARALDALLMAAAERPRQTELCLSHSLVAQDDCAAGHDYPAAVEAVGALVRVARVHAEADEHAIDAPPSAEDFLAHGILSQVATIAEHDGRRTERGEGRDLLMLILMTFYGAEDAARMCAEVDA